MRKCFHQQVSRDCTGRYIVSFPIKKDAGELGKSKDRAWDRCIQKIQELQNEYNRIFVDSGQSISMANISKK